MPEFHVFQWVGGQRQSYHFTFNQATTTVYKSSTLLAGFICLPSSGDSKRSLTGQV
jgi:hypothetical protein